MKPKLLALPLSALAILGGALLAAADTGQDEQAPQAAQKKFTICMWPNTCGPSGSTKPALPPARPQAEPAQLPAQVPQLKTPVQGAAAYSPDPLQQQILEKSMQDERAGGVVSAIRIQGGDGSDRIIYSGAASLALPGAKIASKAGKAAPAADKDWNSLDMKNAPADQINGMREHRRAMTGGGEADSRAGADGMWGNGRKTVRK